MCQLNTAVLNNRQTQASTGPVHGGHTHRNTHTSTGVNITCSSTEKLQREKKMSPALRAVSVERSLPAGGSENEKSQRVSVEIIPKKKVE